MKEYMQPFVTHCNFDTGVHYPEGLRVVRRISDMLDMYQDLEAARQLAEENPVVYEVYNVVVPENEEHIQHCTTILYPGKVGNEFFMTKGHYHAVINRAEVYFGLKGRGLLVMQTQDGQFSALEMKPGTIAYVPPRWAHRTVNTGDEPFIFFAAYPGDAGHDYEGIETAGFIRCVMADADGYKLLPNPRYAKKPGLEG